jgi:hypothetical protein
VTARQDAAVAFEALVGLTDVGPAVGAGAPSSKR